MGLGQAWESAFLTSTARGLGLRLALAYLCPWAAAWLKEFMSPWGVVEIPFLCTVPINGSAPRSNSKLTSSKLPASPEKGFHKRIKPTESGRHPRGPGWRRPSARARMAPLTHGGCELQGRLRVVLLPVLRRALDLGPGVQEELRRKRAHGDVERTQAARGRQENWWKSVPCQCSCPPLGQ